MRLFATAAALALAVACATAAPAPSPVAVPPAAAAGPDAAAPLAPPDAGPAADASLPAATSSDDLPPPALPNPNDPLEKLYGRKQLNFAGGAPVVSVRLMEGQKSVTFVPRGRMRLYARGGLEKVIEAPAQSTWTVRLKNYEPGAIRWSVQVAEFKYVDKEKLAEAKALWTERGYALRSEISGSLYGIAGHVVDNRKHLLFLAGGGSEQQARELMKELHQKFGFQSTLVSELEKRPHGLLEVVDASGLVLAVAQDLVSVTSVDGAPFLVKDVEHGVGYSWHGRQDRVYKGNLELVVDKFEGLAVVNALPMEEYIRGIVPSEIFARAHPEALKAQAVTARGEVLAKLGTRHLTDPYLLCAEQHCQVYTGESGEAASTNAAIAATHGEALFAPRGGPLVDSVYSAVCGGHTEDNEVVWGTVPDPTLRGKPDVLGDVPPEFVDLSSDKAVADFVRAKPQAFCALSSMGNPKKFRWEKRFKASEVDALMKPYNLGKVLAMAVAKRGVSGRASVLTISGEDGATQIRGELNIRRLFQNLNSAMFVVEAPNKAHPDEWVFEGGGWGHGVGMCQIGAIGRAEHGQSYRDILRHYFNGSEVVRIYGAAP